MLFSVIPLLLLQPATRMDVPPGPVEIVEVRSTAAQRDRGSVPGLSGIEDDLIEFEGPTHPNELFDAVPGAWISRGSGQEQLTAIRSPVVTGPGACGAFMIIEDRVSIRPAGFCNVNSLFEVNLLQAQRVDVLRGPGSVIYGSNALHGVLDVTSRDPAADRPLMAGIEAGTDDYYRGQLGLSTADLALNANYTTSRSFREDEEYQHALVNGVWLATAGSAEVRTQVSWADLDQETAGFIFGKNAYKDPLLRTGNVNPEAFRKGDALRLSSHWTWAPSSGHLFELIPYFRTSDMEFLQHFLPGQPLERNGQDSAGLLFSWSPGGGWGAGIDMEWADGFLVEFQEHPTQGSAFLMETRPQGFHYDYDVRMLMLAAWAQLEVNLNDNLNVTAGLRGELLDYDYTNNMLNGNTRDDGTACGFGGCLYARPADRADRFGNFAPELGLNWSLAESYTLFARVARGFRAPQATELYRLQSGQQVADLDSETLDTLEAGLRHHRDGLSWDLTGFVMRKDHFIFRDAEGSNVSDGETDHLGVEASVDWQWSQYWGLGANASWARHEYAFDRPESGIVEGKTVDTAPEWLAATRLKYRHGDRLRAELEWVYMDEYFLEPANEHRYTGHDLFHLRAFYSFADSGHGIGVRVTNVLDEDYAERADYAFGEYRYFPGAGRRFFLEWRYVP